MDITVYTSEDVLKSLWCKTLGKTNDGETASWHEQQICIADYGVGMEEALDHLYANTPDFKSFKEWIKTAGILPAEQGPYNGEVLTEADRSLWEEQGYIVIKNAVTPDACAAARKAIWEYLGAEADKPDTWYEMNAGKRGMMLRLFQHEALTRTRYAPKIKKAYEELYDSKDIFLVVDKVSFNPPENEKYRFAGSALHWDVSVAPPVPYELQGFLYLTDTAESDGAFHCVPGFHRNMEAWLNSLPAGTDPREEALRTLSPVAVPGKAGDLVVWHQALPHCATPNKGVSPRMVQYIAYKPRKEPEAREWL